MATMYVPVEANSGPYVAVQDEQQLSLMRTFETGMQTYADLREHAEQAYLLLDRDDI